jgi:flagellar basal-body rod protein FlgB
MQPIQLYGLISQHNEWLATRQCVVASNIANANSPGYKALDLEPFEAAMLSAQLRMEATQPGHLAPEMTAATAAKEAEDEDGWDVFHSGSSVSIEQEMMKGGEVSRAYSLNTNITKAFHRMMLASARPGG